MSGMISQADLDNATLNELAELVDQVVETQKAKRAEAKERVTALKEEMAGLQQRRTRRVAEPEAAERTPRKAKKGKKRRAE